MFALFHCFSFINAAIEMYLHLCKISMRKIFSEAVNYFSQKSSAIDVLQGPGYASELLLQNHAKHCDHYCVKSFQIRNYFWSVYGKYGPELTPYLDTFHAVHVEYLLVLMSPFAWMFLCFLYLMEFFIKVFHEGFQLTFTFLKSTTIETPEKR